MQFGLGTIATVTAIVLAFLCLLPQSRPGLPGLTAIAAQETEPNSPPASAPMVIAGEMDPASKKLKDTISVYFDDNKLVDVINYFQNAANTNFVVAWPVLEHAGVRRDTPITLLLKDTGCDTALALVLQLISYSATSTITYTVVDGVVLISTKDDIDQKKIVRIYDCIDLTGYDEQGAGSESAGSKYRVSSRGVPVRPARSSVYTGTMGFGPSAMDMQAPATITLPIGSKTSRSGNRLRVESRMEELGAAVWQLLDQAGSVSLYENMLIVRGTPSMHQEVQETLTLLRKAITARQKNSDVITAQIPKG